MCGLHTISAALLLTAGIASADPFQKATVGVPVSSIVDAEAWYLDYFGADVEMLRPFSSVSLSSKLHPESGIRFSKPTIPSLRYCCKISC